MPSFSTEMNTGNKSTLRPQNNIKKKPTHSEYRSYKHTVKEAI